ncbi:hypothetical protein Pth03_53430 [Planotetraspora thailandica]|uniref:Uncharacterized protein n=1 Tax=Planotetraspora thailandica TaxID=487172 RepID=A0A8J3VA37_9ACTN|nr:hypothetical protein [Planotetraspora thailandica]GII56954.1 hypothetical protein Pth03_53430 [Planotetraspora thailandica]
MIVTAAQQMVRRARVSRRAIAAALAVSTLALVGAGVTTPSPASAAPEGGDRLTTSAVTVTIPADHPDASLRGLRVTVSQTKNLVNQGIQVTWSGWKAGTPLGDTTGNYFMQAMQCWGGQDPDVPTMPNRRTCQYGPLKTNYGNRGSRSVAVNGQPQFLPFRPVTGAPEIDTDYDPRSNNDRSAVNQYWNYTTQNGIQAVPTSANGTGSLDFEVQTGAESPGLGCGDRLTAADGKVTGRPCWLVVVPRGAGDQITGPMEPAVWANALAFRLDFVPAGSACALGAQEVRIAGSELATDASLSWQRRLCRDGAVYTYGQMGEPEARRQLLAGSSGAPAAAVTVNPVDPETLSEGQSVDYAPLTLSGIALGYVYEAPPVNEQDPPEVKLLTGTRIEGFKLTPRLVAKLLTMSYRNDLSQALGPKKIHGTDYAVYPVNADYKWGVGNPLSIVQDPDFVRLNPIVKYWPGDYQFNFMVPLDNSDQARAVWSWILQDASARRWLSGVPDEWGMRVNPYYSTNADYNPTDTPAEYPVDNYPLSDPWCDQYPLHLDGYEGNQDQRPERCATERKPYVSDGHQGGQFALVDNDPQKNVWDPSEPPPPGVWKAGGRALPAQRRAWAITDTATAERYKLSLASLCDGNGAHCVTPTTRTLQAAVPAMTAVAGTRVRQLDPAKVPDGAYPLTVLSYAAVPYGDFNGDGKEDRSAKTRADLARYVTVATTEGQTSGTEFGQLPPGYTPLPKGLRAEARAAAKLIAGRKGGGNGPGTDDPKGGTARFTVPGEDGDSSTDPDSGADVDAGGGASDPRGAGLAAGPLAGSATPADPGALSAALVPALLVFGLLTGAAAPLLGRLRRRTGDGAP